ncbi:hypothetical protein LCGC14_0449100 [marine sediment metagenome]|uniref:Uncharacterized protein n=1 Tax=marine sediment metagenome TaxID=412755 RepID=A0A0F9SP14_9ZZZZ
MITQKPKVSIRIKITGIREKAKWGHSHKQDIGKEGVIIDWVDKKDSRVWIPQIILYDGKGTVVYGDKVWWKRV